MLFILPNDNFSHYSNHHYLLLRHFFWGLTDTLKHAKGGQARIRSFFVPPAQPFFMLTGQ